MAQKRQQPSAPIFNSKRPRPALITHPGNAASQTPAPARSWGNSRHTYSRQPPSIKAEDRPSNNSYYQAQQQTESYYGGYQHRHPPATVPQGAYRSQHHTSTSQQRYNPQSSYQQRPSNYQKSSNFPQNRSQPAPTHSYHHQQTSSYSINQQQTNTASYNSNQQRMSSGSYSNRQQSSYLNHHQMQSLYPSNQYSYPPRPAAQPQRYPQQRFTSTTQNSEFTSTTQNRGFIPSAQNSSVTPSAQNSEFTSTTQNRGFIPSAQNSSVTPSAQNSEFTSTTQNRGFIPSAQNSSVTPSAQNSEFTPYRPARHQPKNVKSAPDQGLNVPPGQGVRVGAVATGHALEPAKSQSAQTSRDRPSTKSKPSLRLLTATAQGVKHWAKYKTHTPLLFEIYGHLLSPGVSFVSPGCKQFTIQTSDGPLCCQFWEIDRPLPPLIVKDQYRVVGQWDNKGGVVKSYSVRAARPGELESVTSTVEWSDRAMRKFTSNLSEK